MPSSNSGQSKQADGPNLDRLKVIWPGFIIVIGGFLLVILNVLGIKLDMFMING